MTYTKLLLSGSTNGKGIKVGTITTPGTTIHTAVAGTSSLDEVWLYAVNSSNASVKLTVEWGDTTAPDGNIEVGVDGESGLMLVIPGLLLRNGLVISAFASASDVLCLHGYVNRVA